MSAPPVRVLINGQAELLAADTTLDAVIARLRPSRSGVAAAVGDEIVPRADWGGRALRDGDEVEILTAVQGG
jgi:sulfur carrier protein